MGSAWDSMKTIVGLKERGGGRPELDSYKSDSLLAQDLDRFYVRFDTHDFSDKPSELKKSFLASPSFVPSFNEHNVINCFKHCRPQKSPGPDSISSCMLKACAEQLGLIFNHIFRLSLSQQRVPHLWKQSVVVPVAKVSHLQTLNGVRPVALTSLVVKSLEKLLKAELLAKVESLLDPFQFA